MSDKLGRNGKCHCGSNIKYKKCCLKNDELYNNNKEIIMNTEKKRKTIVLQFNEPKVLDKKVQDGSLYLKLDFGELGIGDIIINKTDDGYSYEDVPHLKKTLGTIERLMWEFELPQSLKSDIESLTSQSSDDEPYYINNESISDWLENPVYKKQCETINKLMTDEDYETIIFS